MGTDIKQFRKSRLDSIAIVPTITTDATITADTTATDTMEDQTSIIQIFDKSEEIKKI